MQELTHNRISTTSPLHYLIIIYLQSFDRQSAYVTSGCNTKETFVVSYKSQCLYKRFKLWFFNCENSGVLKRWLCSQEEVTYEHHPFAPASGQKTITKNISNFILQILKNKWCYKRVTKI